MSLNEKEVHRSIVAALTAESDLQPETILDIAFHMTDWLSDLPHFYLFCQQPDPQDAAQVEKMLIDFLVHVPNHVAAASKLLTGIAVKDILHVNALSDNYEDVG